MSEALAHAGVPTIPVRVYQDPDGQWKKEPLRKWDEATTNRDILVGWWRSWPDAKPGIPLKRVGWVAIDLDDYDDADFRAAWVKPERVVTRKGRSFVEPEHYSIYKTPSGGRHIVFAQPDPPLAGRMKWSAGVEVLGLGCLLTVYDWNAILYPRVAQRCVLPEVFRRPWDEGKDADRPERYLINNYERVAQHTPTEVAVVRDALFALDPCDWRGEHDAWLSLANAAKWEGVSEDDWVTWSLGDEFYRRDERLIRRKWWSLTPTHGGALWAALSEAGIKVRHSPSAGHGTRGATVIDEVPYPASGISQPTRNWRARIDSILRVLERDQTERMLFSVACVVAEVIAEVGKPKPAVGRQLLEGAGPKLIKEIGIAEVRRTIANAFRHVEEKFLGERE
jgi:Bifunctional DNA primase/polymerase, N-terminal